MSHAGSRQCYSRTHAFSYFGNKVVDVERETTAGTYH